MRISDWSSDVCSSDLVAAGVVSDDMAVVGDAHPHSAPVRIGWPRALDAILMSDETLRIEAEAAIEPVVVKEDQSRGAARRDLDIAFEAIGMVTRDRQNGRASWRERGCK